MLSILLLIAPHAVVAAEPSMPAWWGHWVQAPSFKSAFVQEGESAAFGKLTRKGSILTAKGGRLRVEYDKGVLLVSDGRQLMQYDPSTRTAQKFSLDGISDEWPLLRLLTDPNALAQVYSVVALSDGKIKLMPKKLSQPARSALPEVLLDGRGKFLHRAEWRDGTGALQVLTLTSPKNSTDPGKGPFELKVPVGTKWIQ
jgi:outer membrane lipoprotein-sorting protein